MLNIIRADIYRIIRGKGVYITLVVLLAIHVMQIMTAGKGTFGINYESIEAGAEGSYYELVIDENGGEALIYSPPEVVMDGKTTPIKLGESTDNLLFFLLPLLVIIAAAEFSTGTVKNIIAVGIPRRRYYFAKLILAAITAAGLVLFYIISGIIGGTIANGLGGRIDAAYLKQLAEIFLPQFYLILAYVCIALFVTFTLKSKTALISVYLACVFVPSVLIILLGAWNEKAYSLINYQVYANIQSFGYPDGALPLSANLTRALILGGVYIVGCTVGGMALFRRSEIK